MNQKAASAWGRWRSATDPRQSVVYKSIRPESETFGGTIKGRRRAGGERSASVPPSSIAEEDVERLRRMVLEEEEGVVVGDGVLHQQLEFLRLITTFQASLTEAEMDSLLAAHGRWKAAGGAWDAVGGGLGGGEAGPGDASTEKEMGDTHFSGSWQAFLRAILLTANRTENYGEGKDLVSGFVGFFPTPANGSKSALAPSLPVLPWKEKNPFGRLLSDLGQMDMKRWQTEVRKPFGKALQSRDDGVGMTRQAGALRAHGKGSNDKRRGAVELWGQNARMPNAKASSMKSLDKDCDGAREMAETSPGLSSPRTAGPVSPETARSPPQALQMSRPGSRGVSFANSMHWPRGRAIGGSCSPFVQADASRPKTNYSTRSGPLGAWNSQTRSSTPFPDPFAHGGAGAGAGIESGGGVVAMMHSSASSWRDKIKEDTGIKKQRGGG